MQAQQYALPPESVVDVAFQYAGENYNLRVNTNVGMLILSKLSKKETDTSIQFAYSLPDYKNS